jgi:S1/P1 Nuclease
MEPSSPPSAEALRFVIHFVGDLHMPLHASDNNDLGGNCVPVKYLRRNPKENHNTFSPSLHSLWDVAILERDMEGAEAPEYSTYLESVFTAKVESWRKAGIHVDDWAWESHDLAESAAYGNLIPRIPVEPPVAVASCTDANHIGERMLALHVSAGDAYQSAAASAIEERLAQAGVRLAMILNAAVSGKLIP